MTDAYNAMGRLISVFTCETLEETFLVNLKAEDALLVEGAEFVWETSSKPEPEAAKGGKKKAAKRAKAALEEKEKEEEGPPSSLTGLDLRIPRGQLVVLCGPVGSGKSSLLQGLIGSRLSSSVVVTWISSNAVLLQAR